MSNSILASGELGPDHAKNPVTHNSSETGDTVGDPLKDSSGSKLNIVMKLTAMCGVVVDVFAGAFRRECDNHGNLLAVHEIAETWKQSAAADILNGIALDYLVNHHPLCGTFGVALGPLGLLVTLATGKQVTENLHRAQINCGI